LLAVALGGVTPAGNTLPEVSAAQVNRRGQHYIAGLPDSEKKGRMLAVFDAYMDGKKSSEVTVALKSDTSLLRAEREDGERKASVRDFHSLRVTWVTLAPTAGVPLEVVQKVTGHKTTDIVLKHYFQPGREDFRQTLQSAMPKLLTNGHKTAKEEKRELIDAVKPKAPRERLLKVWAKW
jgi:integrase